MKKNANVATLATNPSKDSKKAKKSKELTKANVANVIEKAKGGKETRYIYPEGVKTAADKKAFRRNSRQQRSKYQTAIAKLRESNEKKDRIELKKLEKEQAQWMLDTYTLEYQKSI